MRNLGLLIIKNHLHLKFVEIQWLKHFNIHLCAKVVWFSKKEISQEIFLELMEKIKQLYGFTHVNMYQSNYNHCFIFHVLK